MDDRSIGLFDSGLGGISVLKEAAKLMPYENFIYLGDSAHAPYGTKTADEVLDLSRNCTRFLLEKNVKAIVIACNTATSASAEYLRAEYPDIPIIGIEPALKPAVLSKKNARVAVMATTATLNLEKFQKLLDKYKKDSTIYSVACPGLMEFVERGETDSPALTAYLEEHLKDAMNSGLDAIVLGCTHYPFVEKAICKVVGPDVKIFNGSYGTSIELHRRLEVSGLLNSEKNKGTITMYNSLDSSEIIDLCWKLYNYSII